MSVFFSLTATVFGKGAYFARDFAYSAQPSFSPKDNKSGHRFIFQCMVLTGQYTNGDSSMIEPPIRTGKIRFDSVTDNALDPAIFVIFKDSHAYPEYLVTFK
jgi:poly [ADP-ribose] polymerase 10/14/15